MKIKTRSKQNFVLYKILSKLRSFLTKTGLGKILFACLILIMFSISSLYFIHFGIMIHRTQRAQTINSFVHNVMARKLEFIGNFFKGLGSDSQKLHLEIKFKHLANLQHLINKSLKSFYIPKEIKDKYFPANITLNNKKYKVKIRLMGSNLDHLGHPDKFSFRVKVKDNTIMGLKEFSILRPETRGHISEWICHQLERYEGLLSLKFDFINLRINGDDRGLYILEEHFGKHLLERNRLREGIIIRPLSDGQIHIYNKKKILKNKDLSSQMKLMVILWKQFIANELPVDKLFDISKLARSYALADLFDDEHSIKIINLQYYFNPMTHLLEPIGREWSFLRYSLKNRHEAVDTILFERIKKYGLPNIQIFKNKKFLSEYIKQLEKISSQNYLQAFLKSIEKEMNAKMAIIYNENPFYAFPIEFFQKIQKKIRSKLEVKSTSIIGYLKQIKNHNITLALKGQHPLPIMIHDLSINNQQVTSNFKKLLPNKKTNEYTLFTFPLKGPFTKYNNLKLKYSLLGLKKTYTSIISPWPYSKNFETPTHPQANFKDFAFIKWIEKDSKAYILPGSYTLNKDLIFPPDIEVIFSSGVSINLIKSSKILSYSPLLMQGTAQNPIKIFSSDKSGEGLTVINTGQIVSTFNHVHFKNLTSPKRYFWTNTGAVTFYQANVLINYSSFKNIHSEDALNIIRSNFKITNSEFQYTHSDALDIDFGTGQIYNLKFSNLGNDGLDVSGSTIKGNMIFIDKANDKGVSIGERSKANLSQVFIKNSKIALASKDESTLTLNHLTLSNCQIGLSAYQKKSEFGPGIIRLSNFKETDTLNLFMLEKGSSITLNKKKLQANYDHIKDILYAPKNKQL